jgi:hypothetical protein
MNLMNSTHFGKRIEDAIVDNKYDDFVKLLGKSEKRKLRNATRPIITGRRQIYTLYSPLTMAARQCRYEMLEYMLSINGIDVNYLDDYAKSMLMHLIDAKNEQKPADVKKCFNLLLANPRIDVNLMHVEHCTALMYAAPNHKCTDIIRMLRKHRNMNINITNSNGKTALLSASYAYGCASNVRELLKCENMNINGIYHNGQTTLHIAAYYDKTLMSIRQLLNCVNIKRTIMDRNGQATLTVNECRIDRQLACALLIHGYI